MRKILLLLSILMLAGLASANCTQSTLNMASYPAVGVRASISGTVPPSCIGGAYVSNIAVSLYDATVADAATAVLRIGACGTGTIWWQTIVATNPSSGGNTTDRYVQEWTPYVNPVIGKTITNGVGIPAGVEFCIEFEGVDATGVEGLSVSTVLVP